MVFQVQAARCSIKWTRPNPCRTPTNSTSNSDIPKPKCLQQADSSHQQKHKEKHIFLCILINLRKESPSSAPILKKGKPFSQAILPVSQEGRDLIDILMLLLNAFFFFAQSYKAAPWVPHTQPCSSGPVKIHFHTFFFAFPLCPLNLPKVWE